MKQKERKSLNDEETKIQINTAREIINLVEKYLNTLK